MLKKKGIEIILTIGMKGPRQPEFHFPSWLREEVSVENNQKSLGADQVLAKHTFTFIKKVLMHTKKRKIKYFQVENEPLSFIHGVVDGSLDFDFLKKEIRLIKENISKKQKLLLTTAIFIWPPFLKEDTRTLEKLTPLADALGINVYHKIAMTEKLYLKSHFLYWQKLKSWAKKIKKQDREAWVSELQAEPWEKKWSNGRPIHIEEIEYPSANPDKTVELVSKLTNLGYENILLWGCEYWYWHKINGRNGWWSKIKKILSRTQ